jgi:hypothetical protein
MGEGGRERVGGNVSGEMKGSDTHLFAVDDEPLAINRINDYRFFRYSRQVLLPSARERLRVKMREERRRKYLARFCFSCSEASPLRTAVSSSVTL